MKDLGLLIIRVVTGGLLAGHGAQKLFGSFGGRGLEGTSGWMESMGMRPGRFWAQVGGGAEFFGGILTALGFLHPLGPLMTLGPMGVAIRKVHWGKPIWVGSGGAELPVVNIASAATQLLAGPGVISVDGVLGTRLGWKNVLLAMFGVAAGLFWAINGQVSTTREPAHAADADQEVGADQNSAARRGHEKLAA